MSSKDTRSIISLPAMPVSLSCFNNEPTTRSPTTTFSAVQIASSLIILFFANKSAKNSSGVMSVTLRPSTMFLNPIIASLYVSAKSFLSPFTASNSLANLSELSNLRKVSSTISSVVPPSRATRSRCTGVVTEPVEPSSDPHSLRVRPSCSLAVCASTSDICAP